MKLRMNSLLILSLACAVDCHAEGNAVSPSSAAIDGAKAEGTARNARLLMERHEHARKMGRRGKSDKSDESESSSDDESKSTSSKSSKSSSKSKKKKRSKKKKNRPRRTHRPTPSPTYEDEEDTTNLRFIDGDEHTLTEKAPPKGIDGDGDDSNNKSAVAYRNIVLENGSTLTVQSGVAIEASSYDEPIDYGYPAISVSESSLKIEGYDISIKGMSFEENPYGGYGGHAISFLEGSKGKIAGSGCGDTDGGGGIDPGTGGGPEPVFCEISAVNPDHQKVCRGEGEFCQLDTRVCMNKSMTHQGKCAETGGACDEMYQPVCGCDRITYDNDCKARAAGVSVMMEGECYGDGDAGTQGGGDGDGGVACYDIYQPVCGSNGITYSNDCYARAAGVSVFVEGECDGDIGTGGGGGGDAWDCQAIGQCLDPYGECGPPVKCEEDPCSLVRCGYGEECRKNQCGGCYAECTCPKGQCRAPDDGACAAQVRCFADPCQVSPCGKGETCTSNYCGGCNAVCTPADRLLEVEDTTTTAGTVSSNAEEAPSCSNDGIQIIGGAGDPLARGGDGRGGVALQVYGSETWIQIEGGATLKGGEGSIMGYALEIAEARVTISGGHIDGDVLVAKRGRLDVHGGTFTKLIEVLGDTPSVEFVGCIQDVKQFEGEGFEEWSFEFSGGYGETMGKVLVLVHEGGVITLEEECEEDADMFNR